MNDKLLLHLFLFPYKGDFFIVFILAKSGP